MSAETKKYWEDKILAEHGLLDQPSTNGCIQPSQTLTIDTDTS